MVQWVLLALGWDTGRKDILEPHISYREEIHGQGFKQMSDVIRVTLLKNNHSGHREDGKDWNYMFSRVKLYS